MKTLEQAKKAVEARTLQAEERIKERREARHGRVLASNSPKAPAVPLKASSKR